MSPGLVNDKVALIGEACQRVHGWVLYPTREMAGFPNHRPTLSGPQKVWIQADFVAANTGRVNCFTLMRRRLWDPKILSLLRCVSMSTSVSSHT